MSSDRSWMKHRFNGRGGITEEYKRGVDNFVEFAQQTKDKHGLMGCPCTKCKNLAWITEDEVKFHLYQNGIIEAYTIWYHHGEKVEPRGHYAAGSSHDHNVNEDEEMYDAFEILREIGEQYRFPNVEEEPNKEATDFYKVVNDASVPLYPNCKEHSKLSFVTKLLHFKNMYGCSQKGFDELLKLIGSVLPSSHTLPETYQNVKNMVRGLHLKYERIDACENDCMLFYKDDAHLEKLCCDICGADRYKVQKDPKKARVAKKILRYFPLIPRLQRLFMSKHTAEYMRWHKTRDVVKGRITHPADGNEWKQFDRRFSSFASESRNVRLGLATDGFQPFHDKYSRGYSVWPVFIVVYNLPPSMCMKDQFIIMPLIIPGNRDPTKDLNVYLRPLIDELKILWNTGVTTYDKSLHSNFLMKAALLWTISDFPAYGMLSGWSTHGRMSCPICLGDVKGFQLKYGGKASYYGTSRVFLESNDPLRKNNKYGSRETRSVTTRYSGTSVKNYCKRVKFFPHGKIKWRKPEGFGVTHNWTHMSMFWELPYWETLQLRHCLDVMHTEKNVFDNIFYTILNGDKTKDNKKSRKDCEHLKIRKELWIRPDDTMPQAPYALTRDKVDKLCKWLKDLELPDGCSSNIARCSKEDKKTFKGMKSHDCHVFLQKLMPIVVRDLLPKSTGDAIIELCNFFKDLCSTTLKKHDLEKMEKDMVKILCKLELIFTPGFFDTMEHLLIHLATECILGGPVQYRWMYVFERYLHKLKLTVKNKARVEGSMAERYIEEELTNFCSLYFESDVATVHNRLQRNEVPQQNHYPHLLEAYTYPTSKVGKEKQRYLTEKELEIVKYYVLINMPEVAEYLDQFEELTYKKRPDLDPTIFEAYAKEKFISWLEGRVKPHKELHDKFKDIIEGPFQKVKSYPGCKCNGYKFVCSQPGQHTSPNSGLYVQGTCYNEIDGNYYGRLEEVVKLTYRNGHNIMLFKCHWFDSTRNVKVDKQRMTTVNVKSQLDAEDIFVLASQAVQVYYAPNINNPNSPWYTVVTTKNPPQNEITSCAEDALQQEESNASMSHVEPIVIENPANFFIDLTNFGTNAEYVPDGEEDIFESEKDDHSVERSDESEEESS